MNVRLNARDALIVVDVQVDFLPGGVLAVPSGNMVIPVLNQYIQLFSAAKQPVFYTRDWHPADHASFRENGGLWPAHCVADSPGASFPEDLLLPPDNKFIIAKGVQQEFDAYSGFQATPLLSLLQERGVRRVFIGGLATEYCVKSTVIGALNLGFTTCLLSDAVQGIDVNPGQCKLAVEQMLSAGAIAIKLQDLSGDCR